MKNYRNLYIAFTTGMILAFTNGTMAAPREILETEESTTTDQMVEIEVASDYWDLSFFSQNNMVENFEESPKNFLQHVPEVLQSNEQSKNVEETVENVAYEELEEELESEVYTLTDENGDEHDFELLAQAEIEGVTYLAMIPVEEQDEEADTFEYIILKGQTDENGEDVYLTIDDDDEFEKVADYFDDLLSQIDYDQE